jgi:hypothetical protein
LKLTDGSSIIIKIYNPLLENLVLPFLNMKTEDENNAAIIQELYLHQYIEAAKIGTSGSHAKIEKFIYDKKVVDSNNKDNSKIYRVMLKYLLKFGTDMEKLSLDIDTSFEKSNELGDG